MMKRCEYTCNRMYGYLGSDVSLQRRVTTVEDAPVRFIYIHGFIPRFHVLQIRL
ncbi:hypothetical protein HanIR_Chr01g0032921 [Helianthus annuus]|nr:hypothetical protein HanIR_Chr01g0032921 [Helianthus annuus]